MIKIKKSETDENANRVLPSEAVASGNFFQSDRILRHYLKNELSEEGHAYVRPLLDKLGQQSANLLSDLSQIADKKTPELIKRDKYGETLNKIDFHPAYFEMMQMAIDAEMFAIKWEPTNRLKFGRERHLLGFSIGQLFTMAEAGLYCPLCMTDGVARIIDRYAAPEDKANLIPLIYSKNLEEFYTGAMFLTEKAGGSDVGANLVSATHVTGNEYVLNGEKWFCSNVNADLILALARTQPEIKGTKGLSIFLIEKEQLEARAESLDIIRLKDKIGVRSMASAEVLLKDIPAKLIGTEGQGFYIMADMINLSRLYNSVTAVGIARRALIEAYQYLSFRQTFGKTALEHVLVRGKLAELAAIFQANFYITMRAIKALDNADNGDKNELELLRLLTPIVKKVTAEAAVYVSREAMEAIGGIAYIEESVLPKLLRDSLVLPIWEGAGNIMILDMLRASFKSDGVKVMVGEMLGLFQSSENYIDLLTELSDLKIALEKLAHLEKDEMEAMAKPVFEKLTFLYQIAMLIKNRDVASQEWIDQAIKTLTFNPSNTLKNSPIPPIEDLKSMLGWEF